MQTKNCCDCSVIINWPIRGIPIETGNASFQSAYNRCADLISHQQNGLKYNVETVTVSHNNSASNGNPLSKEIPLGYHVKHF